jgi:phage shock protein PspC (stress-responsive transcriptional regulator)
MNEASMEHGFFRWIRELGLRRGEDHWVGGVASGVATRFGIAPILVRGIFVALCFVAGLGLLVYGVGWALLPGADGKIHVQEAIAGRWSSGMSGALVFFVIGAVGSPALFGWWDGGFWTLLVILGVCFLVFSRSGRLAENAGGKQPAASWATGTDSPAPGNPAGSGAMQAPASQAAAPTASFAASTGAVPGEATHTTASGTVPDDAFATHTTAGAAEDTFDEGSTTDDVPASDASDADATEADDADAPAGGDARTSGGDPAGPGAPGSEAPTTPLTAAVLGHGPFPEEQTMPQPTSQSPASPTGVQSGHRAGQPSGSGPTPPSGFGPATGSPAPGSGKAPRQVRGRSIPGYVATIVLGLAVLAFALVTGLEHLGMLQVPASPLAVGFAVALIIIALGVIGAALSNRTGGALVGFGIVALVFALVWGGGSLRDSGPISSFRGITTTDGGGTTNVFHSGELDLRSYSTITSDTTVRIDNVFSSTKLIVPDNIPVVIDSQSAFGSQRINGATAEIRNGSTVLNAGLGGPELRLQIDGAFSSIEINVEKAEVAP